MPTTGNDSKLSNELNVFDIVNGALIGTLSGSPLMETITVGTVTAQDSVNLFNEKVQDIKEEFGTTFGEKQVWHNLKIVMPDIKDVKIIFGNEGEPRGVIVYFEDGTEQKAVCSGDDIFNFETGISICVTKKLLDKRTDGHGHSVYNKIIEHAVKVYEHKEAKKEKVKAEAERIAHKKVKRAEKCAARKAKKEAEAREKRIQEQAEAYVRAMKIVKELE